MTTDEKLAKAMDLLNRTVEHLGDTSAPDPTWYRDLYLLTGEHMILTEEGWEPGSSKQEYLDAWRNHPHYANPILDEVNGPN